MADIVTVVWETTALVVIVNAGDFKCPGDTVTVVGTEATVGSELVNEMAVDALGAAFKLTVFPPVELPPATVAEYKLILEGASGFTVRVTEVTMFL